MHFGTAKKDALDVLESGSGGDIGIVGDIGVFGDISIVRDISVVGVAAAAINNFLQTSSGTTVDVTEDVAVELLDDQLRPLSTTRFLSCNHLLPTRPSRLLHCRV